MSDIPEKAVEAAAAVLSEHGWAMTGRELAQVLAAALPHLASAQPQPSKSDEELSDEPTILLTRQQFVDLMGRRAKTLGECGAIARAEETANASFNGTEAARRIKKKIAALRAPAEKEAEG